MDVPSVLLPPLTRWLKTFEDPRGRRVIFECPVGNPRFATKRDLSDVAVVMARQPNGPLAVQYFQESSKRGLAWFPSGVPNEVDWVRALLALWADGDPEGLPGFRDWHIHPDWMANEELDVTRELSVLLQERNSAMERFAAREAEIKARLLAATQAATIGARRVLTCQGDDLVMAVSQMLESLGFAVKDVDATKTSGVPKREDLRLTLAARDSWEAIVEVKGYTKSAGKMADLHQLERHASHYAVEKGRLPDLLIYIVNGEIETTVSPELRRRSFHEEDLHVFATDGVVLPTPDLFRLHRDRLKLGIGHVQRLLLDARGLFTYPAKDK
jgi:hypothetical protein